MRSSFRQHAVLWAGTVLLTVNAGMTGAAPTAGRQGYDAEVKKGRTKSMSQDTVETRNRQAVRAGFEAWRKGTGSVFDLLAPGATWTIVGNAPVSGTYRSRQEFLDVVITPFNARLSGRLVPTVRDIYADGDTVVVLWDGEGTARDGKPYKNTYSWFLQMRDGRIVKAIAFFDTIEFTDLWKRVPAL